MTKYLDEKFSVSVGVTQEYRDNWEVIFGKKVGPDVAKLTKEPAILHNSALCLICEDEIVSRHVHDYVKCSCGHISVDGGREYIKRGFFFGRGYLGDDWIDLTEWGSAAEEGETAVKKALEMSRAVRAAVGLYKTYLGPDILVFIDGINVPQTSLKTLQTLHKILAKKNLLDGAEFVAQALARRGHPI